MLALVLSALLGATKTARIENPWNSPVYDLSVKINPESRQLSVSGTATLPPSKLPQSMLYFQLLSQAQNIRFEIVSPAAAMGPLTPKMGGEEFGTGSWSAALKSNI